MSIAKNSKTIIENMIALVLYGVAVTIASVDLMFVISDSTWLKDHLLCLAALVACLILNRLHEKQLVCVPEIAFDVAAGIMLTTALMNAEFLTIGLFVMVLCYLLWRNTDRDNRLLICVSLVFWLAFSAVELYKTGGSQRFIEKFFKAPAVEGVFIFLIFVFVWSMNTKEFMQSHEFKRVNLVLIWIGFVATIVFAFLTGVVNYSSYSMSWLYPFRTESCFMELCINMVRIHEKQAIYFACILPVVLILGTFVVYTIIKCFPKLCLNVELIFVAVWLFAFSYALKPMTHYVCSAYQKESITVPFAEVLTKPDVLKGFEVSQFGDIISTDPDPWVNFYYEDFGIKEKPQNVNIVITSLNNSREINQFYGIGSFKFKTMRLNPGNNFLDLAFVQNDDLGIRLDLAQSEEKVLHVDRLIFNDFSYIVDFVHRVVKVCAFSLGILCIFMLAMRGWNNVLVMEDDNPTDNEAIYEKSDEQ